LNDNADTVERTSADDTAAEKTLSLTVDSWHGFIMQVYSDEQRAALINDATTVCFLPLHFKTLLPNRGFFPHCTHTHALCTYRFLSSYNEVENCTSQLVEPSNFPHPHNSTVM